MSANVHTSNTDYKAFLERVREEQPDLLLLQKIDSTWLKALEPLKVLYPHDISQPRSDNFGIALFSRLPLETPTIKDLANTNIPSIEVRITVNGQTLTVLNYHTLPPVTAGYVEKRNQQLAALGPWVREQPGPVIIAGDLNVTMWSPFYKDALAETGLHDTRRGFGIRPTWPANLSPIKIPLDYCLTSPSIHTLDFRVSPDTGSDHRPIVVDLYVPAEKNR